MRLSDFQEILREKKLDCAILAHEDPAVFYFVQTWIELCFLYIPAKGSAKLVTSGFEKERLRRNSEVKTIIGVESLEDYYKELKKLVRGRKRIGINKEGLSVRELENIRKLSKAGMVDVSDSIEALRAVKTSKELRRIRKACRITDKILSKCFHKFSEFKTELDVKNFLEIEAKKNNCGLAFDTIVASGKDAALPHYDGSKKLVKGFCVIDFGVRYKGYCSDVTRTIYLGNPDEKEKKLYNLVLNSNLAGIETAKAGVKASIVDSASRNILGKYKKNFIHNLGHHFGTQVHEGKTFRIGPHCHDILQENMTITIEPGIYIKNKLGIRIEDDIIVKKGKATVLSKATKRLLVKNQT